MISQLKRVLPVPDLVSETLLTCLYRHCLYLYFKEEAKLMFEDGCLLRRWTV